MKNYIYFLIVVSGVSVVDCKWDKILKKNGGCLLSLWKNVRAVFFIFVYLSLIWILLFKMFIVVRPMILCLISVI